jgi:hypothetical protein
VRDARARAGTFLLDIKRFHGLDEGRACPRVPYLTYPFCTRLLLSASPWSFCSAEFAVPYLTDAGGAAALVSQGGRLASFQTAWLSE